MTVEHQGSPPADSVTSELSRWLGALADRARLEPERIVIRAESGQRTTAALEREVCSLARSLVMAGARPGVVVGVLLDREPHAITAFLAVLRIGATYLPLDPATPAARLTTLLRTLPRTVVLTSAELESHLTGADLPTILVGGAGETIDGDLGFEVSSVADDLPAYLMLTSGSTGAPQGVIVSRRALARYVKALAESFDLKPNDVFLHTASFSFSASIRQLVSPLAAGATLAIASETARHDPFELLARMRAWGVTVWDTVPSIWRTVELVVAGVGPRDEAVRVPNSLRRVQLTGEPLAWDLVRAWRNHLGSGVEIFNLYSQTETAGTVAVYSIPRDCSGFDGAVPFGDPLPGVELLVLDQDLEPIGPGGVGEIFVASDRLADGYLDSPELSADRFLRNLELDRVYDSVCRTGDFARFDEGGTLVPAGRRDHRIKIRGFRVDLGEVENELLRDPRISQAVVCAESSGGGEEKQLVAYLVSLVDSAPGIGEVRERLATTLPPQSIPSLLSFESDIPRTVSGKVDRSALAERRRRRAMVSSPASAVDDGLERDLLSIWRNVLDDRAAGLDDDFFEHGGDSLSAISLFVDIERRFGVRLPPSTLFEAATVRSLAARLRQRREAQQGSILQLNAGGELPPFYLVHTIWEHLPHLRQLVELLDPELPVYALEPARSYQELDREADVDELIAAYAREIREASPEGPVLLGGWSIGGLMAFGVAGALAEAGVSAIAVLLIDAASPRVRPTIRYGPAAAGPGWWRRGRRLFRRQVESLRLSPREQWERLQWMARETGRRLREAFRRPARQEMRERMKEQFRIVVDQFEPRPYRGKVTLFLSQQNATDPRLQDDLGWGELTGGNLEIVHMPGDHVSIVIEPRNMRLLAEKMTETIERALEAHREPEANGAEDSKVVIDRFLEETRKLVGRPFAERPPWNNVATRDAIRQFAFGIGDDNPLWSDPEYAEAGPFTRLLAPPTFLVSARYPILHGAPVDAPLLSLLRDIEMTWERRVFEGDAISSSTEQGDVREVVEPGGNRRIYVDGLTTYRNAQGEVIGRARGTVVRMPSQGDFRIEDWTPYPYGADELARIQRQILAEERTGARGLTADETAVGAQLPGIVRGPLTIGDMVCWHAAIGPSYRAGPLGFKDTLAKPQFRVIHPTTGWPIKYMLQHEDWKLAHQRGMPAPFDNGIMRFAWVSPLITNWMGDRGFLVRLAVTIHLPVLYGDTCWYSGEITERSSEGEQTRVGIRILGTNQNGSITTSGSAEVLLS